MFIWQTGKERKIQIVQIQSGCDKIRIVPLFHIFDTTDSSLALLWQVL